MRFSETRKLFRKKIVETYYFFIKKKPNRLLLEYKHVILRQQTYILSIVIQYNNENEKTIVSHHARLYDTNTGTGTERQEP
ncbi:beta-galactosidase [Prevotella sp. MGM1]|nr:beta-galactosidase [Prevotella sp. MGM1]